MIQACFISILLLLSVNVWGYGAPPLQTGDTRVSDPGRWDNLVANTTHSTADSITLQLPTLDFSYGLFNGFHLRWATSIAHYYQGAKAGKIGANAATLEAKWRFFQSPGGWVSVATSPQTTYPTVITSTDLLIAPNDTRLFFPLELSIKSNESTRLNLEIGMEKHSQGPDVKVWGLSVGYHSSPDLEWLAETQSQSRTDDGGAHSVVNLGVRYFWREARALVFSMGQTTNVFPGENYAYYSYLGVEFRQVRNSVPNPQSAVTSPAPAPSVGTSPVTAPPPAVILPAPVTGKPAPSQTAAPPPAKATPPPSSTKAVKPTATPKR